MLTTRLSRLRTLMRQTNYNPDTFSFFLSDYEKQFFRFASVIIFVVSLGIVLNALIIILQLLGWTHA